MAYQTDPTEVKHKPISVLVLGDTNTGKSALRYRFFNQWFSDLYWPSTICFKQTGKKTLEDGSQLEFDVWDYPGNVSLWNVGLVQRRTADFVIYCYCDIASLESITGWHGQFTMENNKAISILVGTKADKWSPQMKVILSERAKNLAMALDITSTLITSSLDGTGYDSLVLMLVSSIWPRPPPSPRKPKAGESKLEVQLTKDSPLSTAQYSPASSAAASSSLKTSAEFSLRLSAPIGLAGPSSLNGSFTSGIVNPFNDSARQQSPVEAASLNGGAVESAASLLAPPVFSNNATVASASAPTVDDGGVRRKKKPKRQMALEESSSDDESMMEPYFSSSSTTAKIKSAGSSAPMAIVGTPATYQIELAASPSTPTPTVTSPKKKKKSSLGSYPQPMAPDLAVTTKSRSKSKELSPSKTKAYPGDSSGETLASMLNEVARTFKPKPSFHGMIEDNEDLIPLDAGITDPQLTTKPPRKRPDMAGTSPADRVRQLRAMVVDVHKLLEGLKSNMDNIFIRVILVVDMIAHATLRKTNLHAQCLDRMVKALDDFESLMVTLSKSVPVLRRWMSKAELRKTLDQSIATLYLDSQAVAEYEDIPMPNIEAKSLGANVPPDVIKFWFHHFGRNTLFVRWEKFVEAWKTEFKVDSVEMVLWGGLLRYTLDICCTGAISLDRLIQLGRRFSTLENFHKQLPELANAQWFFGYMDSTEAVCMLSNEPPATYLIRFGNTTAFALAFVDKDGKRIRQTKVDRTPRGYCTDETYEGQTGRGQRFFETITEVIAFYCSVGILGRPANKPWPYKSYFFGNITGNEAALVLQGKAEGTYLLRWSNSQKGVLVLSYTQQGGVKHTLVHPVGGDSVVLDNEIYQSFDDATKKFREVFMSPCYIVALPDPENTLSKLVNKRARLLPSLPTRSPAKTASQQQDKLLGK